MTSRPVYSPVSRSAGFTLLEVIVAFVILSLSLGVIYQIFGQGLRATSLSERYTHATLLAQSLMAETGVTSPLHSGTQSGSSEAGYEWQVETSVLEQAGSDSELAPISYKVEVHVGWSGHERAVSLTSIRLGDRS